MPPTQNANKRVEKLFSDIKDITDQPAHDSTRLLDIAAHQPQAQTPADGQERQREVEALTARINELEAALSEAEKRRAAESGSSSGLSRVEEPKKDAVASSPLLYEKERVGFVYSDDKLTPVESISTTLPRSDKALSTPLVASGQVIGEMQIHPAAERAMTAEDESLASAVAQQVSLQIQNLRLLDAAERARAEALEATRQFTHQSWESFLDGIRNSERIGFAYNQSAVTPFMEPSPEQHDHKETVRVLDEQIGALFVKADPAKPLSDEDRAMISSVASQVSQ